jgi:hypothetical protein
MSDDTPILPDPDVPNTEAEPDPEEFAENVGVDPTPQEVDRYRELAARQPPWTSQPED